MSVKGVCQDDPISTVGELIEKLKQFPKEAKVRYVYDSALRNYVNFVWKTQEGDIALCGYGESVDDEDCPEGFDEYETPSRAWDFLGE